jgi:gamma-glutamylcyclotransferase (GGCT)/AIG2-like uncharacterized protein YtfP
MSDGSGELVFVYGTLRRGGSNSFRMDGAEFIASGQAGGAMFVISWYPGLVLDMEKGHVLGDLYRVGPEQLAALDEFEGLAANELEGGEYRRVKTEIILLDKPYGAVEAWVWEWKGEVDPSRKIPSGDWMDVEKAPQNPDFTLLSVGALPFLLITAAGVDWVSGRVLSQPEENHLFGVLFWLLVFYTVPVLGILAARAGEKRFERWRPVRWVSCIACTLWIVGGFFSMSISR